MAVYYSLPGLLRDASTMQFSSISTNDLCARAWVFRQRLLQIQPKVDELMTDSAIVQEVPSLDTHAPFATCYRFTNLEAAQAVALYWRLLIIINRVIEDIDVDGYHISFHGYHLEDIRASSLGAASNILRLAENSRRWKPLCSFYMAYNLPVAFSAYSGQDSSARLWIASGFRHYHVNTDKSFRAIAAKYLHAIGMGDAFCQLLALLDEADSTSPHVQS